MTGIKAALSRLLPPQSGGGLMLDSRPCGAGAGMTMIRIRALREVDSRLRGNDKKNSGFPPSRGWGVMLTLLLRSGWRRFASRLHSKMP